MVVLVVDDDADVLELAASILAASGLRVLRADDPRRALEVLRSEQRIDLLFTDLVMPDLHGFELAAAARRLRPDLKLLYTTGYASIAAPADAALHAPILPKPWRIETLRQAVTRALGDTGG